MKKSSGGLFILKNFIFLLIFMSAVFIADALFFLRSPDKLIALDRTRVATNDLLIGISKLEYMLDIYVVAGEFEAGRSQLIKEDIASVGKLVDTLNNPDNADVLVDPELTLLLSSINGKWKDVASQAVALDKAKGSEEVLFIHNYVDQTTYALSEDMKKFKVVLDGEWGLALKLKRDQDIAAIVISLILVMAVGVLFIIRVLMPVKEFLGYVENAFAGEKPDFKLTGSIGGEFGDIYRNLAEMANKVDELTAEKELAAILHDKEMFDFFGRISALKAIAASSARTLSHHDAFMEGISKTMLVTGAYAGAVYVKDVSGFKLSVSKGFSSAFFYKGENMSADEACSPNTGEVWPTATILRIDEYVDGWLKDVFKSEGVKMLLMAPVMVDERHVGTFLVAFNSEIELTDRNKEFVTVVASNIASSYSHAILFNKEFSTRSFYERVIEQMSFGIGVFSHDGVCVVANSAFKKNLIGYANAEFAGIYNIFDDEKFLVQGAVSVFKKAFDGLQGDFVLQNKSVKTPSVSVLPPSVKIIVLPLFTSSGTVGHIMLKTEALKE